MEPKFTILPTIIKELDSGVGRILQIAWSPGGLFLAGASESGSILLWRRDRETYHFKARSEPISEGKIQPWCLAWSNSGGHLFSGWSDGFIRDFKAENLEILRQTEEPCSGPILSLAFHPQGHGLASVAQGEEAVLLWNTGHKKLVRYNHLPGHAKQTYNIAWHPEGEILASCGADEIVRLWRHDTESNKQVELRSIRSAARQVVWSPDADPLLARIEDEARVILWRVRQSRSTLLAHQGTVASVAFSPDGLLCVSKSFDGKIRLWEPSTGEPLGTLEDHGPIKPPPWPPVSVELAFRPSRQKGPGPPSSEALELVNLSEDGQRIRIWKIQKEQLGRAEVLLPPRPIPAGKSPSKSREPAPSQASMEALDTVRFSAEGDQSSSKDELGFAPYAEAIASFLSHPGTQPPLTLSIEGEWGAGKSSFMIQVADLLRGAKQSSDKTGLAQRIWQALRGPGNLILSFNVWRHDKEEAVWAAFALELMRQLRRQSGLYRRVRGWLGLFIWRLQWMNGLFTVLRLAAWILIALLVLSVTANLAEHKHRDAADAAPDIVGALNDMSNPIDLFDFFSDINASARDLAVLVLMVTVLLNAKQLLGNPFDLAMGKYLRSMGWEDRIAFVERFHEDFDRIIRAYAGDRRVFVFVDDLDRCDVPKAAELMQAINLLISENPRVFFVLGMDRQKVAAGLAVKYESLFPYLFNGTEVSRSKLMISGLEHGYEFMEKFVQIPYQLPKPSLGSIENLLVSLGAPRWQPQPELPSRASDSPAPPAIEVPSTTSRPSTPAVAGPGFTPPAPAVSPETSLANPVDSPSAITKNQFTLGIERDSPIVTETVLLVAPALDYNPRRVKQFINAFRLRAFITYRTGLLAFRESSPGRFTFFQLGKLVAISLRWPLLMADLAKDSKLLQRLEDAAKGNLAQGSARTAAESRWAAKTKLMDLLRGGDSPSHSLAALDVDLLLTICLAQESATSIKTAKAAADLQAIEAR